MKKWTPGLAEAGRLTESSRPSPELRGGVAAARRLFTGERQSEAAAQRAAICAIPCLKKGEQQSGGKREEKRGDTWEASGRNWLARRATGISEDIILELNF